MSIDPTTASLPDLLKNVRLEPWGVDYLGSVQHAAGFAEPPPEEGDDADAEPLATAAVEVELPLADWRPLTGRSNLNVERTVFLDGVRRVEARLLLENAELSFGVLGSSAVAAVTSTPGARSAEFAGEPLVQRWCALAGPPSGSGASSGFGAPAGADTLTVQASGGGQRLNYRVTITNESDVDAPVRLLQERMLEAERRLAGRLLPDLGEGLLVCDGPRPLLGSDARVLGYIKTVKLQRLPRPALDVVRRLAAGERSPLYLVGSGEAARFEWYLRLRDPGPWAHTLAGSVRLQAYAGPRPESHLGWAQQVADWSCAALPRYATRSHQDPRAPQQLLPVRALEQTLRRRLGSAPLIRRRVMAALSSGRSSQ